MEPIKVIIVNNENIIITILSNPFVSFFLGMIVTIILTIFIQKRNETLLKKEKLVEIKISINTIIKSLQSILVYMRPNINLTFEVISNTNPLQSSEDIDKAIKVRKEQIINDNISIIFREKQRILPLIEIFINQLNTLYFNSLFDCYDLIIEEFYENPIAMKKQYEDDIKTMILNSTRDTFIKNLSDIIETVYKLEIQNNRSEITKLYKLNSEKCNYTKFFSSIEQKAINSKIHYKEQKNAEIEEKKKI